MRSEVRSSIGRTLNQNSDQQYLPYVTLVNKIGSSKEWDKLRFLTLNSIPCVWAWEICQPWPAVSLCGRRSTLAPTASPHRGYSHHGYHGYHWKSCFKPEISSFFPTLLPPYLVAGLHLPHQNSQIPLLTRIEPKFFKLAKDIWFNKILK